MLAGLKSRWDDGYPLFCSMSMRTDSNSGSDNCSMPRGEGADGITFKTEAGRQEKVAAPA
jgi:hypothetical protein